MQRVESDYPGRVCRTATLDRGLDLHRTTKFLGAGSNCQGVQPLYVAQRGAYDGYWRLTFLENARQRPVKPSGITFGSSKDCVVQRAKCNTAGDF